MPAARPVLPGQFYFVTRRCVQRQLLLRPDAQLNNIILYCLAVAAKRFQIDIIMMCVMSNHHHTALFDRFGNINEFTEHFHKLTAKCINALRGRNENVWSSEPVSKIVCVEPREVLAKIVYAATNPVKDFLVDTVAHWPGVNGLFALLNDKPLHATRPTQFFRSNGTMPADATLHLVIPPELGDADEVRRIVAERVARIEKHFAALRSRTGRRVLGRQTVLLQSWRDSPKSTEPRRAERPKLETKNRWARIESLQRDKVFVAEYREAREKMLAGSPAVFPPGTYWLRRFANVTVAPLPR